jgi:hypothetical protein
MVQELLETEGAGVHDRHDRQDDAATGLRRHRIRPVLDHRRTIRRVRAVGRLRRGAENTSAVPEVPRTGEIDVSVVIPVYDAATTLADCLGSLLVQSLPRDRYEIIVVDNGSHDGSEIIARETPGVVVLHELRPGPYAARNRGIREARGRAIAFTDPDCVPGPEWLEAGFSAIVGGAQVVLGETLPAGRSRALDAFAAYVRARDEHVFNGGDPSRYYGRTNNMAVAREAFDSAGPFTETERGADTTFVRAVVGRWGTGSVRFEQRMQVRHAELATVRAHLRKTHIYGYVHQTQHGEQPIRGLEAREWLDLLLLAGRPTRDPATFVLLVVLTAASAAAWTSGRVRAAIGLRAPRGAFRRRG